MYTPSASRLGTSTSARARNASLAPRELVLVGLLLVRPLALAAQLPEDQHDAEHRGEQDELLAERVERTEVEVQRGDQVSRVALGHADPVEHASVHAVVVAERRQAGEAVHEHDAESGRADPEQQQTRGPAHRLSSSCSRRRSRSCWWTLRSASRIITGRPTVETTISDNATSGAWKTKNIIVRASP